MQLEIIEKSTITKWLKNSKYNFEIPLDEVNNLCWRITDEFSSVDAWDIPDENFVKYLIENQIMTFDEGHFSVGNKFDEFFKLVKSELYE